MILVQQAPSLWSRIAIAPRGDVQASPVTHRFTMQLRGGTSETVMRPNAGVRVRCRRGRLWITHDGDPRDIVLGPDESYTADSCARMLLHAVQDCEMEMQFSRIG